MWGRWLGGRDSGGFRDADGPVRLSQSGSHAGARALEISFWLGHCVLEPQWVGTVSKQASHRQWKPANPNRLAHGVFGGVEVALLGTTDPECAQ